MSMKSLRTLGVGIVLIASCCLAKSKAQGDLVRVDSNSSIPVLPDSVLSRFSAQISEARFKCDILEMNRWSLRDGSRSKVKFLLETMPVGDLDGDYVSGQVERHLDSLLGLKVFVWFYKHRIPRDVYVVGWDPSGRAVLLRGFGPTEFERLLDLIDSTSETIEATRSLVDFYLRVLWSTEDYMAVDSLRVSLDGGDLVATAVTHDHAEPDPVWVYYEHRIVVDKDRRMNHSVDTIRTPDAPR